MYRRTLGLLISTGILPVAPRIAARVPQSAWCKGLSSSRACTGRAGSRKCFRALKTHSRLDKQQMHHPVGIFEKRILKTAGR